MELPDGVTLDKLLKLYEQHKKSIEHRNEWFKTEEGKAYQRAMAKKHYDNHKEEILERRAKKYLEKGQEINERNKAYYQANRERILERRRKLKEEKA